MTRIGWIAGSVFCLASAAMVFAEPARKPARESAAPIDSAAGRPTTELTEAAIEKRLKQVERAVNLDEGVRKALVEKYTAALEHLKTAAEHDQAASKLRQETANAPKELEQLKVQLEGPPPSVLPAVSAEMGLAEMEENLAKAEKTYEALQERLAELDNEPERRAQRRIEIPKLHEAARQLLDEIEKQPQSNAPAGPGLDPAAVAERVLLAAHRRALEQELAVYEEELRHYELTVDLIEARRDHAVWLTGHTEKHLQTWRSAVNERRRREAQEQVRAAQAAAENAPPSIRRLADDNAGLSDQRQDMVARIEIVEKETAALQQQVNVLKVLFDRVKVRVDREGLSESIGLLLRRQQDALPDVAQHQRFLEARKAEISTLYQQVDDLEDQRRTLDDIDSLTTRLLTEIRGSRLTKDEPSEAEVRALLETTKTFVTALIADTNTCVDRLIKLEEEESKLVERTREFSDYIREYILWIRSAELPRFADTAQLKNAAQWLVAPGEWTTAGQAFMADGKKHPWIYLSVLAALVTLALSPRIWRRILRQAGRDAAHHQATSVWPTVLALLATVVLSAVWPTALWLAGWRLGHLAARSEFLTALAHGLKGVALLLATINFTRHLCRTHGLGEAHFGWPHPVLDLVRRSLWWLTVGGLPLAGIVLIADSQSDEGIKNSLGRAAFVLFQVLLLVSAHRVWHAPQGLARVLAAGERDRWWLRICRLGHLVSILAPVALVALAVAGYYYTAVQLAQRLLVTSWLVGGLLVLHASLLRWVLVAYRDLAMQRVREQQVAEAAAIEHLPASTVAETTVQLSDINQQTHKLLGLVMCAVFLIGFSVMWVEVLPALEFLDNIQAWPHPFAKIENSDKEDPKLFILSLGGLAAAVLILLVTTAAARNVPGLIEISILRQLRLDAGSRYAIGAVTQYAITVLGLSLAFGKVGVGWKDVQWLVAAMTVGLGFGLQEIFANFASGLLLLFERPIRVGDTVSVGDVTGKVTRIRIRATTIVDGDMRELIVPNKEFISGKVMNWTLTDTTTRMTIKIGVPRGSDPDLVRQLLLHVATSHPLVLKDPPPHALFDEFADDTLNFTLRVYMGSRDVYNQLRHELNAGINAALHESGIDRSQPPPDAPAQTLPHAA